MGFNGEEKRTELESIPKRLLTDRIGDALTLPTTLYLMIGKESCMTTVDLALSNVGCAEIRSTFLPHLHGTISQIAH